ncbi:MAG: hypothetical protein Aureis2KO_32490 [Aureisphaera sp.]
MKNLYLILFSLLAINCFGQETFYKNYKIRNFIDFLNDGKQTYDYDNLLNNQKAKIKFLSREKCIIYNDLPSDEKDKINDLLKLIEDGVLPKIELKDCSGNILLIDKSNFDKVKTKNLIGVKVTVRAKTFGSDKDNSNFYRAGLLMEKNRLYVNLWPFKENSRNNDKQGESGISVNASDDSGEVDLKADTNLNKSRETREVLFYEIPDDHMAIFRFTEFTMNAITIPLKYRFRTNRDAINTNENEMVEQISISSEEFSTSINIALFGGYSWGKTKFTHRKKIGNRIKNNKNTIGAFLGSSAVELKGSNTNIRINQVQSDREGTIGTISFGIGYVKSWNKISLGVFYGIDKGVGRVSKNWVYDDRPWLGIGLGYDLFKL